MRNILLQLVALLLLAGCGTGLQVSNSLPELAGGEPTLWTVRLGRGGSELFAGILVMRRDEDMIKAVLLDSSGVKLLEEDVYRNGEYNITKALPLVRDKGLPAFLGKSLARLFFNNGDFHREVCRWDGFSRICSGERGGQQVKLAKFGPFVLWSADYSINNYGPRSLIAGVRLNSFWPAPYLEMERKDLDLPGKSDGKDR